MSGNPDNPCMNPEPHKAGTLPCCAGIIFNTGPTTAVTGLVKSSAGATTDASNPPSAHPTTPSTKPLTRDELREKIVTLRHERDAHQMDEPEYVDAIMAAVDAWADRRADKRVEEARIEGAQFNWICQKDVCGAYNPYDCRQCRVCGAERPKIYSQQELDAAMEEARKQLGDQIEDAIAEFGDQVPLVFTCIEQIIHGDGEQNVR
jgi:hypothetical protein